METDFSYRGKSIRQKRRHKNDKPRPSEHNHRKKPSAESKLPPTHPGGHCWIKHNTSYVRSPMVLSGHEITRPCSAEYNDNSPECEVERSSAKPCRKMGVEVSALSHAHITCSLFCLGEDRHVGNTALRGKAPAPQRPGSNLLSS